MPRPPSMLTTLRPIIEDFAGKLAALIEAQATDRAREAVVRALDGGGGARRRGPGRPPGSGAAAAAVRAPARRSAPVSPKQARARKLQGQYMGGMRSLSKGDQAKVKATRAKDGIEAAIALAAKLKNGASK